MMNKRKRQPKDKRPFRITTLVAGFPDIKKHTLEAKPMKNNNPMELLISMLLVNLDRAKPAKNNNEIICHCHQDDCTDVYGDHGHLYIKVEQGSPLIWHCFKCNKSGVFNREFINHYFASTTVDPNLIRLVEDYNKTYSGNYFPVVSGGGTAVSYNNVVINEVSEQELFKEAYKYMLKRLVDPELLLVKLKKKEHNDLVFDPMYYQNRRVILNTKDFLNINRIYITKASYISMMHYYHVGFLHDTGAMMNLRYINNPKLRYHKINLYNDNATTSYYMYSAMNPYVVSDYNPNVDYVNNYVNVTADIQIYIGEGPLDILGFEQYYRLCNQDRYKEMMTNSIFCAAGGKNYTSALKYIISKYNLGINKNQKITVHYLLDRDVAIGSLVPETNVILEYVKIDKIYNHYNYYSNDTKDFGVPHINIKDKSEILYSEELR